MLKEGKFGMAEGIAVITVLITSKIFIDIPQRIVETGKTGAWMIPVIATLVALAGFTVISLLMKRFPGLTLVEATTMTLGPWMGGAINYIYLFAFIMFITISLRQFGETIIMFAIPLFPPSLVLGVFTAAMIITLYYGLEPIARCLFVASPFMLGAFLLVLLLLFPFYHIHNLFPIFGSPLRILAGGVYLSFIFFELLFLPLIMPVLQGWKYFRSVGYSSVLISGAIFTVFIIAFLLVFPHEIGSELTSPYYSMARTVYLGRFLQRTESLFLVIWVIIGAAKMSLLFYGCLSISARVWGLNSYKPLIPAMGILIFTLAMLFPNMAIITHIKFIFFMPFACIIIFILPLITFAVAAITKKGRLQA